MIPFFGIFFNAFFLTLFKPPRDAQPVVLFSCTDAEPMVIDNLPFDKYELEPSPLTQFILERKQPHSCWQVSHSSNYFGHSSSYFPRTDEYVLLFTSLKCI